MAEVTLEIFLWAIGILVAGGLFIAGLLIHYLKNIDTTLGDVKNSIAQMPMSFWKSFIDVYLSMQKSASNPVPDRKIELLQKLRAGTIIPQESLELKDIMEQEAKAAQASQDLFRLILIIGIIIVIAMMLSEK